MHSILSAEVVDATAIPYVASNVCLTQNEPIQPGMHFLKFLNMKFMMKTCKKLEVKHVMDVTSKKHFLEELFHLMKNILQKGSRKHFQKIFLDQKCFTQQFY